MVSPGTVGPTLTAGQEVFGHILFKHLSDHHQNNANNLPVDSILIMSVSSKHTDYYKNKELSFIIPPDSHDTLSSGSARHSAPSVSSYRQDYIMLSLPIPGAHNDVITRSCHHIVAMPMNFNVIVDRSPISASI